MKVKDIFKDVWRNISPTSSPDIRKVIPLQVDPLRATLCHEDTLNVDSDISLILNERRITDAGVLEELKKRFTGNVSSSNPFEGLTDEEIINNTANWRCQSMSEKKAYINYVAAKYGHVIDSLKDSITKEETPVEPTTESA